MTLPQPEPAHRARIGHSVLFAYAGLGGSVSLSTTVDVAKIFTLHTPADAITGAALILLGTVGGASIAAWIAD